MIGRLLARREWRFFAALWRADRSARRRRGGRCSSCAACCRRSSRSRWACSSARCSAASRSAGPLALVGVVFVLLQVLSPIHQAVSANLGDRTAAWLYDRLTEACVRPPGMGHLEDPTLTSDLTVARDFDLGMTGPPLSISMDFIAERPGRDDRRRRVAPWSCAATRGGRRSCSPARGSRRTGCCARAPSGATATPTRCARAQRDADYAYRLAVDPPAAKELRLFGLAGWTIERFVARRTRLHELQYEATRLREQPVLWSLLLVVARERRWCSGRWRAPPSPAALDLGAASSSYAQSAVGASMIAFGGLSWALDGAAAPVAAVLRLERGDGAAPARSPSGTRRGRRPARARDPLPRRHVRLSRAARRCSTTSISRFPPARRSPSSARTARARRRSPSCCAGSTTRRRGAIEVDGVDLRELDLDVVARRASTAVFQDFIRFELPLRDNVAPGGAPDDVDARGARRRPARRTSPTLDTVLARGYEGGTDLSGGQWQRVALARALCAVAARRRRRAARRADRAARRARRGRDLRPHPRRDAALHDDPDLASLLDRAPRRSHLRARARPRRRARHARRADGAGRPLPDDVRPAGAALQRRRRRGGHDV